MEISHAVGSSSTWRPKPVLGADISCRYGASCVRRDCTFKHPASWDPKVAREKNKASGEFAPGRIVCRYGQACKHPNCFFAHPDGRVYDGTYVAEASTASERLEKTNKLTGKPDTGPEGSTGIKKTKKT